MAQRLISQQELNELLSPFGFRPMLGGSKSFGISRSVPRVWRPSEVAGCFEIVDVDGDSGGNYTWLYADILSGHAGYIGLSESNRLRVPALEGRIKTAAERRAWVDNFVKIVPKKSAAWARRHGPRLLKQTARARAAAKFYLSFLPPRIDDFVAYWNQLKEQATPEQRELARLSLRPATIALHYDTAEEEDQTFAVYQVASYTITLHGEVGVAAGFFRPGTDPEKERDLAHCYQIMASRMYREEGSELIKFD